MCKPKKENFGNLSKQKYLLDTCIWRDFYQDRYSKSGNPLGKYAAKLITMIISNKEIILFSEFLVKELKVRFGEKEILNMLNIFFINQSLVRIEITKDEIDEAKKLSNTKGLPFVDCLFAIQARNHKAILISQDKHIVNNLSDIVITRRPQELI